MRYLLSLTLAGLLAGCAPSPVVVKNPPAAQPTALGAFNVEGKLAWSRAGKGDSARFAWSYKAKRTHIDVLSPLGSVAATVRAEPGTASLETAKGELFTDRDLESLSWRLFGMELPLNGIEYWVQGQPIPGQPFTESALPEGKRLQQRGFTLDYPAWVEVDGRALPSQVDISNGELTLKIRLRDWSLP